MNKHILCFIICSIAATIIQGKETSPRIIGGAIANAGEFPSAAAVYVTTNSGTFFCGGALINQEWVLTSANCIQGAVSFQVRLGSNRLSGADPNRLIISTTLYVNHPDFNSDTLANDIALIQFHLPITYTDYIKPLYLPTVEQNDGMSVIAVGWGQTSDSVAGLNDQLSYVELATVSNEECQLSFGALIHDTMLCAVGNYNEGNCLGDSGGAIMTTLNHLHWHVGVASFISQNGCETPEPSGFTRTFPYVAWIKSVTGIV